MVPRGEGAVSGDPRPATDACSEAFVTVSARRPACVVVEDMSSVVALICDAADVSRASISRQMR